MPVVLILRKPFLSTKFGVDSRDLTKKIDDEYTDLCKVKRKLASAGACVDTVWVLDSHDPTKK